MIKLYEIVKLYRGYPLFFEDHIERLHTSIQLAFHRNDPSEHLVQEIIPEIKKISPIPNEKNLRIDYISGVPEVSLQPLVLPTKTMYSEGVTTALFQAERPHPNLKEENRILRENTNALLREKGYYEVFLQREDGIITEGSRSNFFLIKGRTFISSPEETILKGITREKILKICRKAGIPLEFREITKKDFEEAEALIITGTSPEILEVKECGPYTFTTGRPEITWLKERFREEKEISIRITEKLFQNCS